MRVFCVLSVPHLRPNRRHSIHGNDTEKGRGQVVFQPVGAAYRRCRFRSCLHRRAIAYALDGSVDYIKIGDASAFLRIAINIHLIRAASALCAISAILSTMSDANRPRMRQMAAFAVFAVCIVCANGQVCNPQAVMA